MTRRWTATITVEDETFDADLSEGDLKKDQMNAAAREAGEYLEEGDSAGIALYKTTQAHGTVQDTRRQVIRYQGKLVIQ